MVAQFVAALQRPVSRVRLENYRTANVVDDLDMVVNYFFNIELSEAFYPSLQAFEIALRNSIHATLTEHFQTAYWFDDQRIFPQSPPPAPDNWQRKQIRDARRKLTNENRPLDADRIVAELNFGFWHSMLNRPFERLLWRPNGAILLKQVFPHAPRRPFDRQIAWDRCDHIRILRNRVMHFEPIWHRRNLVDDHRKTLDALHWISPDMKEAIALSDRFGGVLTNGRQDVERRIIGEVMRRYPQPPAP